ncbi:Rne/Rng family ribonuclease [Aquibacillus albus]|uniref:Ribonuclease G n=1 Tax=Aquibacillus albus TaxID=1168171 RepID=A0ABS2N1N4_9BACI|nr:Rne/Rng family ribonuclease [Aquibacillus albus]MBM7572035.1 ribonuclease G [Aquibacillus albus]
MVSIYIQSQTTERVAIIEEEKQIKELVIDRPGVRNQVGNIYFGKVNSIEKGLQAAFIDIGNEKLGFLQKKEIPSARDDSNPPIESLITEGQTIVVQIIKDAYGEKGPRLTANITIPGIDIIYLPFGNYVAASRKLSDDDRGRLSTYVSRIKILQEGAIIRTSAKNRPEKEVEQEFISLRTRWQELEKQNKSKKVPCCLLEDKTVPDRIVRKFPPSLIKTIYIDDLSLANYVRKTYPNVKEKVKWLNDIEKQLPYSIYRLMEEVVAPKVVTSKGVEIIIEQTEAMTIIDVNTATFAGRSNKEQTLAKANIHAAVEIAKQVRLRNLSGIIIIDFISMKMESHRKNIIATLKKAFANDPIRSEIYGFTKLGLLEMTRKRELDTLPNLLLDKDQSKQKFSRITEAYLLERELLSYRGSNVEAMLIEINPKLYQVFFQSISIKNVKEKVGQEVYMVKAKGIESYRVKLAGSIALINEQVSRISSDAIDKVF